MYNTHSPGLLSWWPLQSRRLLIASYLQELSAACVFSQPGGWKRDGKGNPCSKCPHNHQGRWILCFFCFNPFTKLEKMTFEKGRQKKRRSDGATPTSPKSKIIIWTGKGRISKAALQLGGSPLPRSRRLSGSLCCSGGLDEGRQRVTTLVKLWDIIATSDEVTQRGGDCKGNPLISGKSRLVNYYNWPDYCSQWFLVLPAVVAPPATQVVRTGWQEPPGSSNVPSEVANTRFVPNHITLNDPIQIMFFELLVILVTRCSSSSKSADDLMQVHGFLKAAGLNEEARLAAFSHRSSKREL